MNVKQITATALLLTAAGAAFGDTITTPLNPETSKTRIEVIAELRQAYDQGLLPQNDADFSGDHRFSIRKTASDTPENTSVKTN